MSIDEFETTIRMVGAMYNRFMTDELISAYYRILKGVPLDGIKWACDRLMGDSDRDQKRMPTAAEMKLMAQSRFSESEQGYIECQDHRCESLIPWPTERTDEGRMYCPRHPPSSGGPEEAATLAEKIEIAKTLTPKARAFLRSAAPHLMADIPVTAEEVEFTEPDDKYKLVKERKPASDEVIAESYGARPEDVRRAQHHASTRTLSPL